MTKKPNKFANSSNQLRVGKRTVRTSPYVTPAFGTRSEADSIRLLIETATYAKNNPSPEAKEYLEGLELFYRGDTAGAALRAKGLI